MSFDVFLNCFRNGGFEAFPRALLEEILAREALAPVFPLTHVKYADGGGAEIYGAEKASFEHVMFSSPGGDMFFSALYELADRTKSTIFWPDVRPALAVTHAAVIDHIPADCLKTIGPAYVAANYRELMTYISRPVDATP